MTDLPDFIHRNAWCEDSELTDLLDAAVSSQISGVQ